MSIKNIAALVSVGRHPVSGEARHCRNDRSSHASLAQANDCRPSG
ncbi:MAG: hypothetical protein RLZZ379_1334 [Pseudomonadota bacterium]